MAKHKTAANNDSTDEIELFPIPLQTSTKIPIPRNETAKPKICFLEIFSLLKITETSKIVIAGVVALTSPARVELTRVSARAKRKLGAEFSSSDKTPRWIQSFEGLGREILFIAHHVTSVRNPKKDLKKVISIGEKLSSATLMKRNEVPHAIAIPAYLKNGALLEIVSTTAH
jgi:hypothetical protein